MGQVYLDLLQTSIRKNLASYAKLIIGITFYGNNSEIFEVKKNSTMKWVANLAKYLLKK